MTPKKAPPHFTNPALVTDRLIESEKVYRAIFEQTGIPIMVAGEDATILLVNNKFEELSGYPRGEIEARKKWTDFVDPQDVERTGKYHAELMKPGGWAPAQYSFGFVDRTGQVREISASMTLIAGTKKTVLALIDITPRKKIERMLRLNEDRYLTLVKTLSTGVFRITHEMPGRFIWANPAFLAMFGYGSLTELLKITTADIFADTRDQARIREVLRETGFARSDKIRLKKMDTSPIWASVTAEVKRRDDGTPEWIDGTVENITEHVLAGEELKRTQSRLGELLDAVTTYGLIATDPDGLLTMFNTGSERMLGYRAEELIGKATPLIFIHAPELAARAVLPGKDGSTPPAGFAAFVANARTNGCDEREWTYVRKDGVQIPVDLTLTVMRNTEGVITGYLGVAQEISDRKRLEEAFRYNQLQMSGVIYHIPEPTFAIDRAGRVIAWNRAIEALSGTKAVDILGKGEYAHAVPFYGDRRPMLANLIFATDTVINEQGYFSIRRSGNSVTAETRQMNLGGAGLIIRGIAAPIYDDKGEVIGAIESITDITEVRKKETALQDSESRYRAILDYIGSAVAIIEEDSIVSYINPEFEKIIGYVREEIEKKKKLEEFVAPEEQERFALFQRKRREDPHALPGRHEFRFIRWDGQVRNGLFSFTLIPGTGRTVVSLLDITDKILAEDAVQRANKKLNLLSRITRHDILNQLTALKSNLELTRESARDPGLRASIEQELAVADTIEHRIVFTRDYQDIGIQAPEWQNLGQVILRNSTRVSVQNVAVTVLVTGVEIYADLLLGKVFYNLVDNAVRHGKTLTQVRFTCEESFEELVVICEDDGIGIPADLKESIFDRQYLMNSGLGLFISREILSITGISIRETGVPGGGARFEIRVPNGAYRFITGE